MERPTVCRMLWLTMASKGSPAWRTRFSRMRSKTTMVSWTLNPMTVSIAVTNRASIWRPVTVPIRAKMPTTTMTSWMSAPMAVTPIRKSPKRKVIQAMMPRAPMMMSRNVCWMSSALTTGPTEVDWRTSSMGPNSRLERRHGLAQRRPGWAGPETGGEAPGTAATAGELLGAGDAEADGDGVAAAAVATAVAAAVGTGEVAADASGDAAPDAAGLAPADASGLPEGDGLPTAAGSGALSVSALVRMST